MKPHTALLAGAVSVACVAAVTTLTAGRASFLSHVRFEEMASSRALDAFLVLFTAHAAFVALMAWLPTNYPFKPFVLKALTRAGRTFRARAITFFALISGALLASTESHRDEPNMYRQRLHVAFALLQAYVLLAISMAERAEVDSLLALERQMAEREMLAWEPPADRRPGAMIVPSIIRSLLPPATFLGEANLPPATRKVLFVMNHQLGGFEIPLFVEHMHVAHALFPRALADHAHFYMPGWAQLLASAGAIDGTRENCAAVMRSGQPMLVFPGGGNEIMKSKHDQKYALKWKERTGFARMAMQHQYTIVPVAAVGLEDQLDVLADVPIGRWLAALGLASGSRAELTLPVMSPAPAQLGQRLYFKFLPPIETTGLDASDAGAVRAVRDTCKARLEDGIAALLRERDADPKRFAWRGVAPGAGLMKQPGRSVVAAPADGGIDINGDDRWCSAGGDDLSSATPDRGSGAES